jgi:hypothetical protein
MDDAETIAVEHLERFARESSACASKLQELEQGTSATMSLKLTESALSLREYNIAGFRAAVDGWESARARLLHAVNDLGIRT